MICNCKPLLPMLAMLVLFFSPGTPASTDTLIDELFQKFEQQQSELDSLRMEIKALKANADLVGMEFVMYDPYILDEPGLSMWYVLPCFARFFGKLVNAKGEAFLPNYLEFVGAI